MTWHVRAAAALAVVVALAAIAHSYTVFSQTVDEPSHIVAGVEWLDQGTYAQDPHHPPFAHIFTGTGPYLRGARYVPRPHWVQAGNAILYGNGEYLSTLTAARAGTLPFFLLGCYSVFAWGRKAYGATAGVVALGFWATQPTVLGHAALATNDVAGAATLAYALLCFAGWLERPTAMRGALLGIASGVAVATKFSALLFLPAGALVILADHLRSRDRRTEGEVRRAISCAVALVIAALVVAASYRFVLLEQFWTGVADLATHNREGHPAYLFGQVRQNGWWYYFPVAVWFKSTLALLLGAGYGAYRLLRDRRASLAPIGVAAVVLAVAMTSGINIGVRHVMPVYVFLAILAGHGVAALLTRARAIAALLLAAQLGSFVLAHPDHLAYFNITARREPSRILLDSNLDWGQDLLRLAAACRERRIESLTLAYFGSADVRRHALPPLRRLVPYRPARGWIAISEMRLAEVRDRTGAFAWLRRQQPVARVGKSIRLYYVR